MQDDGLLPGRRPGEASIPAPPPELIDEPSAWQANPTINVFGRSIPLPKSRALRITIGVLFLLGGILGFLPILGFWMVPVGLLILSYEFAMIRRWRRRSAVWWERRRQARREYRAAMRTHRDSRAP